MNTATDTNPSVQPRAAGKPSAWRRGAIAVALVAGGFVLGAGTLASAGGMPWHGGGFHHGPRIGMIQHFVRNALDNVGASTAQENKVHDILAATYTELEKDKPDRQAMRKQILDLMKAPTIDRAAAEKLRAERVAAFDAKSKKIVDAVLDAAGQLTPEQRTKLAQLAEERMSHGGWGGWRHRHHGGPMDDHDGSDHDRGSDHGNDHD